jgi:hypothetical protein
MSGAPPTRIPAHQLKPLPYAQMKPLARDGKHSSPEEAQTSSLMGDEHAQSVEHPCTGSGVGPSPDPLRLPGQVVAVSITHLILIFPSPAAMLSPPVVFSLACTVLRCLHLPELPV